MLLAINFMACDSGGDALSDKPTGTPRIELIDPATARTWIEAGEAVVVDVRETHEFTTAHIEGATLVPLSIFDPAAVPPYDGKKLLIVCASGVRCGMAAEQLAAAGFMEMYRIEGGLMAWYENGGPLVSGT